MEFPIQEPETFNQLLGLWASTTDDGMLSVSNYTIGFIGEEIKFF